MEKRTETEAVDAARAPAPEPTLDAAQAAAVAHDDALSVSVIGAPGSGKTTTLVELVAERVLQRGYGVGEVLVLTPTRSAATRLRDRLALRLQVPTNGPLARTVTSLAFQIVQSAAVLAGTEPPTLLTGAEQDRIVAELLRGHVDDGGGPSWPDPLTADVRALRGFRTELRELMMRATELGLSPARLAALGRESAVPEWVAAGEFAAEYQQVVSSFRETALDSAELLAEARLCVVRGLAPAVVGLRLLVVDDLQELPEGAVEFIATIARSGVTVIAFGDPDVATASFRSGEKTALGALSGALGVPVAEPYHLTGVHRHRGGIRSLVERVTARVGAAAAGRQRQAKSVLDASREAAATGHPQPSVTPVRVIEETSPAAEVASIANLLREHHLLRGVAWNDMAVLVRSGALIDSLARNLALAEVPTRTVSGGVALRDDFAARHLLRVVAVGAGVQPLDDDTVQQLVLGPFGGLDAVSLRRLRLALRHEELAGSGSRTADVLLREALEAPGRLATIDSAPARRVGRLADSLQAVRELSATGGSIEELLWQVWSSSGLEQQWVLQSRGSGILADEANRNLDGVVGLFTAAKRFVERYPHRLAADFIVDLTSSDVPEDSLSPRSAADAVVVSTPNGVIGSEFEVVVVARLQESVWPNLRLRGSLLHPDLLSARATSRSLDDVDARAEVMGDELRMFALAVSRARTQTVLSCVANDDEQPSPFVRLAPVHDAPGRGGTAGGVVVPGEGERPGAAVVPGDDVVVVAALPGHPLTLRALVGDLRRRLVETADPAAASALARLAGEGVAGADPATWYGLLEPSTTDPLVDLADADARVDVSPSKLDTFEKSPLAWFIDRVSGGTAGLPAAIGTVVHSVMEEATKTPDADLSFDALWGDVEARWAEFEFEGPWIAERERRRTQRLITGLSQYLRGFERDGGVLVGGEDTFTIEVGPARLRGSVDRVERHADGSLVVVDLKTGSSTPPAAEVARHAQLGSYQLALLEGAVGRVTGPGSVGDGAGDSGSAEGVDAASSIVNGGAVLLYVAVDSGAGAKKVSYKILAQNPLDDEAVEAFRERIIAAAEGMAGARFPGREGLGERDPHAKWQYRIHLVKAVSA